MIKSTIDKYYEFLTELNSEAKKVALNVSQNWDSYKDDNVLSSHTKNLIQALNDMTKEFQKKVLVRERKIAFLPDLFEIIVGTLVKTFFENQDVTVKLEHSMSIGEGKSKRPDIVILDSKNQIVSIIELKYTLTKKQYIELCDRRNKSTKAKQFFALLYWNNDNIIPEAMIADNMCNWLYTIHPTKVITNFQKKNENNKEIYEYISNQILSPNPLEQILSKILSEIK